MSFFNSNKRSHSSRTSSAANFNRIATFGNGLKVNRRAFQSPTPNFSIRYFKITPHIVRRQFFLLLKSAGNVLYRPLPALDRHRHRHNDRTDQAGAIDSTPAGTDPANAC